MHAVVCFFKEAYRTKIGGQGLLKHVFTPSHLQPAPSHLVFCEYNYDERCSGVQHYTPQGVREYSKVEPSNPFLFFLTRPNILVPHNSRRNVQCLLGAYIVFRSTTPGVGPSTGNKDPGLFMFQFTAFLVFVISVGCQVIGQVALNADPSPGLFVVNVVGLCLFPIYLDGEFF